MNWMTGIGLKLLGGLTVLAAIYYFYIMAYNMGMMSIAYEQYRYQLEYSQQMERLLDGYNRAHLPQLYKHLQSHSDAISKEYQKYLQGINALRSYSYDYGVYGNDLPSKDVHSNPDTSRRIDSRQVQIEERI